MGKKSYAYSYSHWAEKIVLMNVVIFLLTSVIASPEVKMLSLFYFGLTPASVLHGFVWQVFSYMFLHANFWHIFLNMYALIIFGISIERIWGSRKFLQYYFFTGIGAGITIFVINNFIVTGYEHIPTIGASGAVFGILLAFGMMFPNSIILVLFIIPLKAKYLVVLYGAFTFWSLITDGGSGISHAGHLGGMLFGLAYFLYYGKKLRPFRSEAERAVKNAFNKIHTEDKTKRIKQANADSIAILKKLKTGGASNLTDDEYQQARYIAIMKDKTEGLCKEDDFNESDDYCLNCDNVLSCIAREMQKYLK